MKKEIITILVVILLLPALTNALGITPGRTTLNFEKNLQRDIPITILNNEHKDLTLAVYARGSLAGYIEIPAQEITLSKDQDEKQITYRISLPEEMGEPGLHDAEILVREITPEKQKEITISAMQAVITQLHINIPYPGKYIVAKLDILGGKTDKKTLFFVPLINFGEQDIKEAKAELIIMDMYEKVIQKAETDSKEVPARGRAELSAQIDPSNLLPGVYRVIARVAYDGLATTAENSFFIKDFLLIPLDISVRGFTLGEMAKFNILVENIGNIEIKDAYSLLTIDSEEGKGIANLKSSLTDFKPLEKKEMVSYWNTEDIKADAYTGKLIMRYEDKADERGIKAVVSQNSIKAEIIGVTGYAIQEKPSPKQTSPWIIIVILLVIINMGWFAFYFISRKR